MHDARDRGATVRLFTSLPLFSAISSVVQRSRDAEQKPLKEEMGALPGAAHLRVPREGNKRVCHAAAGGGGE
jgi:hypothetical protein